MRGEVGRYAPFEVRVWSNVPQRRDERTPAWLLSTPKHGGLQTKDERSVVRRLGFVILEQGEAAAIESMHLEKI